MKYIRFIISALFITGSVLNGLKAQNTLIVKEAGKQASFSLGNIRKITFTDGNMIISQAGGNYQHFGLTDIISMDFINIPTDTKLSDKQGSIFTLYPVPVNDQLHIRFGETRSSIVQIEIADMLGRVVYRPVIHEMVGNGEEVIDLSQLAKGYYICRLLYGDQIETCNFLKD
jgi:hypothetical protein